MIMKLSLNIVVFLDSCIVGESIGEEDKDNDTVFDNVKLFSDCFDMLLFVNYASYSLSLSH